MNVAILVLAAGSSQRMGRPKQILQFKDTTLIGKIIDNCLECNLNSINIVLGAHADLILPTLPKTVRIIRNEKFENGLSSSIIKGVNELLDYDSILMVLGDQPFVKPDYLNDLLALSKNNPKKVIATNYGTHNGVPAIFPKKYYSKLMQLKGDKGAKDLLNADQTDIIILNTPVNLFDVDTPDDYNQIIET